MPILLYNMLWMAWNLFLACLPLLFIWLYLRVQGKFWKAFLGVLWLLFLPNSIYVITDLLHPFRQLRGLIPVEQGLLLLQYVIFETLGLLYFLLSLYPFEKTVRRMKQCKRHTTSIIVSLNMLLGFAMALGRVERSNSWDVFFAPWKLVDEVVSLLTTPISLALAILLGLFANFFYFLLREPMSKLYVKNSMLHKIVIVVSLSLVLYGLFFISFFFLFGRPPLTVRY
ncbi:MAG: DUF1361 domain-containing protein [Patescibacteria group bacterium]